MKIGILSDIHIDLEHPRPERVLDAIVRTIKNNRIDTLIIAGDVANDYEVTLRTLDDLEKFSRARCLFVPGNHDVWNVNHPDKNSWQIYEELKAFDGNLANGPIELENGWVVIGDLGWYDYSFGSRRYSTADFDRMQLNGRLWQDKIKAAWGKSTIEMHHYFYGKLARQLRDCRSPNIILATHVLPISDFTVQPPDEMWQYLNAFLGSRQYGELALSHKVRYSISGHVHYRKQAVYENTTFLCNCLNYASQWIGNDDPLREVSGAVRTIEIEK